MKLSKCDFCKPKVTFLGHVVGSGEITVVESKIEAIQRIPEPSNKKQLRSFLGMCSFFRSHIPKYSEATGVLTEMTKLKYPAKFVFNEKQRGAFVELKRKMCCEIETLVVPRYDREFIIHTDASGIAVGCTLSQFDDSKTLRPIAYASKKFSDCQVRWSTIEREAYAVLFALQKFGVIVFGNKIILYSDHDPLKFMMNGNPISAKLLRWSLAIQKYDIEVTHIKGTNNKVADCLSRL